MSDENTPIIELPTELEWDDVLDDGTHLYATAFICGIQYHLDAIEVDQSGKATRAVHANNLKYCHSLDTGDQDDASAFSTIALRPGRECVVYFMPGIKWPVKALTNPLPLTPLAGATRCAAWGNLWSRITPQGGAISGEN
jgi:hypothetical protein